MSALSDIEIMRRAYEHEQKWGFIPGKEPDHRIPGSDAWEYYNVGASRDDIRRLMDEGLVIISSRNGNFTKYKLSQKGRDLVWAANMEQEMAKIPATSVLEALSLIIGFDDIKETLAQTIERRKKVNFLLEGPPACAKSLMLEGVRSVVPKAYMAFGSRTSASGLSDALFERHPEVLLVDELDKMHNDVFSVLLGLMESGEIIETKSQKTRGIKLQTMVIGACNSSAKMPREFLSRFALHVRFPEYSRDEFIDVCCGFLSRAEKAPPEIASLIGELVYDNGIGDVRKARGAWLLMNEPTEKEVRRVITFMLKYAPDTDIRTKRPILGRSRLPGM